MHLPFTVARLRRLLRLRAPRRNVGRIFRPGDGPLTPNWRHLPVGYHGRAGTVVVSGTPIRRPYGQSRPPGADAPVVRAVGQAGLRGRARLRRRRRDRRSASRSRSSRFTEHVFGVCLVNDWSARDIQAWESVPLGPFLGKSFGTTVSPWVVPLAALEHARVRPPSRDTTLLPYLTESADWGLDIDFEVSLNGHVISRPPLRRHALEPGADAGPPDRERGVSCGPATCTPPAP